VSRILLTSFASCRQAGATAAWLGMAAHDRGPGTREQRAAHIGEKREACIGAEGGGRRGQHAWEKSTHGRRASCSFFLSMRPRAGPRAVSRGHCAFFLSNASSTSKTAQGDASMDQGDAILSSFVASPTLSPAARPEAEASLWRRLEDALKSLVSTIATNIMCYGVMAFWCNR
jgi:hypothetical protein